MTAELVWGIAGLTVGVLHARGLWVRASRGPRVAFEALRWAALLGFFALAVGDSAWPAPLGWAVGFGAVVGLRAWRPRA